jgi:hypothetical protein
MQGQAVYLVCAKRSLGAKGVGSAPPAGVYSVVQKHRGKATWRSTPRPATS